MTKPTDLTNLAGKTCGTPGCGFAAEHVVTKTDRRGRTTRLLKCDSCMNKLRSQLFSRRKIHRG